MTACHTRKVGVKGGEVNPGDSRTCIHTSIHTSIHASIHTSQAAEYLRQGQMGELGRGT